MPPFVASCHEVLQCSFCSSVASCHGVLVPSVPSGASGHEVLVPSGSSGHGILLHFVASHDKVAGS